MSVDTAALQAQLERWAAHAFGTDVTVAGLQPMPGHAGLSFGFRVVDGAGAGVDDLVMRMPPKGVRRRGNTDVLRQVPLLQALGAAGVPVAEIRYWSDDESWFDVPFFMVGRLPGETYIVRRPDRRFEAWGLGPAEVFGQAAEALAQIHTFDWRAGLASWEAPRDLVEEIRYWDPILAKAAEPAWIGQGERTRDLLLANVPASPDVGVFHGDFQTNNILYDSGGLVAVLDWEISGIGAQLLDLGWLLMMNDPLSWYDDGAMQEVPPFESIIERYAAASGRPVSLDDVAWYRALSGYRFGVITGLNVMLHRTGKRHDPEWEHIALSAPALFGRAAELLSG